MMFTKSLRDRVRYGKIRSSIRIWRYPHVKVGGRYPMEEGHIIVDSIKQITLGDITEKMARESGFATVEELLAVAQHGTGENVYLVRFHYMPPGATEPPIRITEPKKRAFRR